MQMKQNIIMLSIKCPNEKKKNRQDRAALLYEVLNPETPGTPSAG